MAVSPRTSKEIRYSHNRCIPRLELALSWSRRCGRVTLPPSRDKNITFQGSATNKCTNTPHGELLFHMSGRRIDIILPKSHKIHKQNVCQTDDYPNILTSFQTYFRETGFWCGRLRYPREPDHGFSGSSRGQKPGDSPAGSCHLGRLGMHSPALPPGNADLDQHRPFTFR